MIRCVKNYSEKHNNRNFSENWRHEFLPKKSRYHEIIH